MAKAELQAKRGDRLAVTDEVEAQPHAPGGIHIQNYIPKDLQGIPAAGEISHDPDAPRS